MIGLAPLLLLLLLLLLPLLLLLMLRGDPSVFSRSAGVFRSPDGVPLVAVAVAVAVAWPLGDADFRPTGVRLPDDFLSGCVLSLTLILS